MPPVSLPILLEHLANGLVVGAYYGRPGGLIFLGLVAALALAGSSAGERWDGDVRTYAPTSASQVLDEYSLSAGDLEIDLSGVADPEELDGRNLLVENGAGRIELSMTHSRELAAAVAVVLEAQ